MASVLVACAGVYGVLAVQDAARKGKAESGWAEPLRWFRAAVKAGDPAEWPADLRVREFPR